jgi:hypothetical protein
MVSANASFRWNYAMEKICEALSYLSSTSDNLSERLAHAYVYHIIRLSDSDVPPSIWSEIEELTQDLSTHESKILGSARLSAAHLSPRKKKHHLDRIGRWPFALMCASEEDPN